MKRTCIFILLSVLCALQTMGQDGVEIEYIANEGIAITSRDGKVLIDAIHSFYAPEYIHTSDALLEEMLEPLGPYASTKIVLVSHVHGDHFDAKKVSEFVTTHRGAAVVSSAQVIDSLSLYSNADVRSRFTVVDDKRGRINSRFIGRVYLETFGLRHANKQFRWIQNLGHILTIDGVKILHVGDADLSFGNFDKLNLALENIDIAVLPYWMGYDENLLSQYINAATYILCHIPPDSGPIQEEFRNSDFVLFDEVGEKFSY